MDKFKEWFEKYWLFFAIIEILGIPHTIKWYYALTFQKWQIILNKKIQTLTMFVFTGLLFFIPFYIVSNLKHLILPPWHLWIITALAIYIVFNIWLKIKSIPRSQFVIHEPMLIEASDSKSVPHFSSNFLKKRSGGISLWIELQPFGQGIRHLINNRYLFSHATNNGETPYKNVLSLSRGPRSYNPPKEPQWKLWLTDKNGNSFKRIVDDTENIQPGWHHFVVRWNHDVPLIDLLIDGVIKISTKEYLNCWPSEYSDVLIFGSWPSQ